MWLILKPILPSEDDVTEKQTSKPSRPNFNVVSKYLVVFYIALWKIVKTSTHFGKGENAKNGKNEV